MAVTVNLKPQVDLPIWEWPRATPGNSVATAATASSPQKNERYIYYLLTNVLYRYDTHTDSWNTLAPPPVAALTVVSMKYSNRDGYQARVLAADANSVTMAGLYGKRLVGKTIRVIAGTGAGQSRTISAVAAPVVADYGTHQAASSTQVITDGSKAWALNQYRGYQVRIAFGNGQGQCRKVLSNTATALNLYDGAIDSYHDPQWGGQLAIATGASGLCNYAIESNVVTVNSAWTVNPDATSKVVVEGGGLCVLSSLAAAPWYTLQYYDILADAWYTKWSGLGWGLTAALGTDVALERVGENVEALVTGTATSGGAATLTDSGKSWGANRWANYLVCLTGGLGAGQYARVLSNTATQLTVLRNWATAPDATTTYEIRPDDDKLWWFGGGRASITGYSKLADMPLQGRMLDFGTAGNMTIAVGSDTPRAVASITRVTTTATLTLAVPHNFKTGDLLTVRGASQAQYNVTATACTVTGATTLTYTMGSDPGSSATATTAFAANVLVGAAKVWTVNEFANKVLVVIPSSTAAAQACRITSNTATAITTTANMLVTPANGNRYYICDAACFGDFDSGVSTTQTATVLTDSTKNWKVNALIGKWVRFLTNVGAGGAGTGTPVVGQEMQITANAATTLTVGAMTNYPNSGAIYSISDMPAAGAGIEAFWAGYLTDAALAGNYIVCNRGGGYAQFYLYDLTLNKWEQASFFPGNETFTTGSMYIYDGADRLYMQRDATGRVMYLNLVTKEMVPFGMPPYTMGTAVIGNRMDVVQTADGLKYLYLSRHGTTEVWRTLLWL